MGHVGDASALPSESFHANVSARPPEPVPTADSDVGVEQLPKLFTPMICTDGRGTAEPGTAWRDPCTLPECAAKREKMLPGTSVALPVNGKRESGGRSTTSVDALVNVHDALPPCGPESTTSASHGTIWFGASPARLVSASKARTTALNVGPNVADVYTGVRAVGASDGARDGDDDGAADGRCDVGAPVGRREGEDDGRSVSPGCVGATDGLMVVGACEGERVGAAEVGDADGRAVVGARVGERDGARVRGLWEGDCEGAADAGEADGRCVTGVDDGEREGWRERGLAEGDADTGARDGAFEDSDDVGAVVGALDGGCVTGADDGAAVPAP